MPAGFVSAGLGSCSDGGASDQAEGALGSVVLRKEGDQCMADVHLTLFTFAAGGEIKTVRMDADGVVVAGGTTSSACR